MVVMTFPPDGNLTPILNERVWQCNRSRQPEQT
jgi:hypothetical protein